MIQTSKQVWAIGETVKVGFLKLQVISAKATPRDFKPDAYLLGSGKKYYVFVPHNGLSTLYTEYGQEVKDIETAHAEFSKY